MCGITGVINLSHQRPVERHVLKRMTDCLQHRGPDADGLYLDENVALGHRRLKIIDLSSSADQPLFDAGGRVGIVFNGEIYNYGEIRKRLELKGYRFRTHTDTEVILNAYLEQGIACLEEFIGMFAFALYDRQRKRTYLVRDRIGIKPLYFAAFDDRLIFGSEMKAILSYPGFPHRSDMDAISGYLSYRYPMGDRTFFKDINSLEPGHYLEISDGEIKNRKYWDLPKYINSEDLGEKYYREKTHELLESAVRYRMISDVPFGAYLSGGVDSSAIVALMSKLSGDPIKTFTIGFPEKGFNESDFASLVASQYGTDHHEILLESENYMQIMQKLIHFKDAPLSVPNEPALHEMSRELKKYITVVLSGEGADEIFGGYGRIFRSPHDYRLIHALVSDKSTDRNDEAIQILIANLKEKYALDTISESYSLIDHFIGQYQYVKWAEKQEVFSDDMIAYLDGDKRVNQIIYDKFTEIDHLPDDAKYLWIFEKLHIVGLLHRVDTTTMATSVEARVPFVDHRLVEFALSIPVHHKLRWKSDLAKIAGSLRNSTQISEHLDIPKYILKKSFEGELPDDILYRKKMGFPVPLKKWFGAEYRNYLKEILLDDRARNRGIYNTEFLEKTLNNDKLTDQSSTGIKWWMLLNLELWFRFYID